MRADIIFERKGKGGEFTLKLAPGEEVENLEVRTPSERGFVWRGNKHVRFAHFETH
jgi:hypothetical protein